MAVPTAPPQASSLSNTQATVLQATTLQATSLNSWHTPGSISNTAHSPEQLVIQTAIDNREAPNQLLDTLHDKGCQTDVASAGDWSSTVQTNFLSIEQRPIALFVYDVEFVRDYDKQDNNKAVLVTKRFEKEGLFAALRLRPGYARLRTQFNWVTDSTNIWSTTRLFDNIDFTRVPVAEGNLRGTNPNSNRQVSAVSAAVLFNRVINLQQTIGQLYGDSNGQVKGNDDSALLSRGLNAILSKHAADTARSQTTVLQNGANKFHDLRRSFILDKLEHLRAFHGFFISVRPGAQQLLLNINLRCSPFLKEGLKIKDLISSYGNKPEQSHIEPERHQSPTHRISFKRPSVRRD